MDPQPLPATVIDDMVAFARAVRVSCPTTDALIDKLLEIRFEILVYQRAMEPTPPEH